MRTLADIPLDNELPPAGTYPCDIVATKKAVSKNKKTPYVELTLQTGETEFTDALFVTAQALKRLCLVARNVCNMEKEHELPDDDYEAAKVLANYIVENASGQKCFVVIEEKVEIYIPESGPDMGRSVKKLRRKVAFNGYLPTEENATTKLEEDIPFPANPIEADFDQLEKEAAMDEAKKEYDGSEPTPSN